MNEELRDYIEQNRIKTSPVYLQRFHATPPTGWINDPNGFIWFKGRYHLFGQFYPYGSQWGTMHWGHWVSDDLVAWNWSGVALMPDTDADRDGCFSGTAIVVDNKLVVLYTGVPKQTNGQYLQQQCLAWSIDGFHFTKCVHNPVIGASLLPAGCSAFDFRDPKVLRAGNKYWAIVTNMGSKGGQLLTFESDDLLHWRYKGVFFDGLDVMPECVDLFSLNNTDMVILSLIGNPRTQYPHNRPTVLIHGRLDWTNATFTELGRDTLDYGFDFYAPQTTEAPDGRRLMIGWMQYWHRPIPTDYLGHGWSGSMSLVRELEWSDNKLIQRPVSELAGYCRQIADEFYAIAPGQPLQLKVPNVCCIQLSIHAEAGMQLSFSDGQQPWFSMRFDSTNSQIETDIAGAGYVTYADNDVTTTLCPIDTHSGSMSVLLICDTSSIEAFINDGERVISNRVYPKTVERCLCAVADSKPATVGIHISEIRKDASIV